MIMTPRTTFFCFRSDKQSSIIKIFKLLGLVIAFTLGGEIALAQQPAKIPRIGFLGGGSAAANAGRIEAFRQGLRDLGYSEGKLASLPALAAEFVRLKVDIILSAGPTVTRIAKDATATMPIVMGFGDDPVGNGFVASLARPGGNITGLSALSPELSGKQLELLKEIVPRLSRVTVVGSSLHPGTTQSIKEMDLAAAAVKVQLQHLDISTPGISNRYLQPRARAALTRSWCSRALSPILIGNRLSNLP